MTIKERIIDELKGIEFGNDFLNAVGKKWIDEMEENNDEAYILGEIKDGIEYGANTGGVPFVIYCADNENFVKENLKESYEFKEQYKEEYGYNLNENSADMLMWIAVEECARMIESHISLSLEDYEEEEELTAPEIVGIFQEVRENTL